MLKVSESFSSPRMSTTVEYKTQNATKSAPGGVTWLQDLLEHITTVSHVLLLSVTVFVLYICFQEPSFSLRVWHVFLYILGWAFISTQGMMLIAKENIIGKHLAAKWRTHAHWLSLVVAVGLSIGGFASMVYSRKGRKHFSGDHGITGLVSLILAGVACCNGVPALFTTKLRAYISPNVVKIFHSLVGIAAVVLGLWATVTGYNLRWFKSRASSVQVELCVGITIVCTVWACIKPLLNIVIRSKNVISSCVSNSQ